MLWLILCHSHLCSVTRCLPKLTHKMACFLEFGIVSAIANWNSTRRRLSLHRKRQNSWWQKWTCPPFYFLPRPDKFLSQFFQHVPYFQVAANENLCRLPNWHVSQKRPEPIVCENCHICVFMFCPRRNVLWKAKRNVRNTISESVLEYPDLSIGPLPRRRQFCEACHQQKSCQVWLECSVWSVGTETGPGRRPIPLLCPQCRTCFSYRYHPSRYDSQKSLFFSSFGANCSLVLQNSLLWLH